jgi:dienelactone hydrolase
MPVVTPQRPVPRPPPPGVSGPSTTAPRLEAPGPNRVVKTEITIPLPNGTSTLADVYRPQGPGPFPVVVHAYGLLQNKAREAGTATHYASWGLVTVVPKLPFGSGAPPRNAPVLQDIVDWVGKRPSTLGPIDLTRGVGLSGHSFGGLTALLASSNARGVGAVVALDPADLNGAGLRAAPDITAPTAFVIGRPELVNQFGNGFAIYDRVGAGQRQKLTVAGASHMDFQNPRPGAPKNRANATAMTFATGFLLRHLSREGATYAPFTGDGAEVRRARASGLLR